VEELPNCMGRPIYWKRKGIYHKSFYFLFLRSTLIYFALQTTTIVLKAVASHDLWIWHSFFGLPRSHNNITVLNHSPLFSKILNGVAPTFKYTINGNE
jgi:hypothetical protein